MAGSFAPLARYRDQELTLEALVDAAAKWLRHLQLRPDDGRVAETIDVRGIRYYQTLGVIDRPVRYEGRRALYGYRHLLQLLCAKKLQQEGHPLQLVQQALAGRSTETLEQALGAVGAIAAGREAGGTIAAAEATARPEFDAKSAERAPQATARLVAAQVAPGITITVDPSQVQDPEAVIRQVERMLSQRH